MERDDYKNKWNVKAVVMATLVLKASGVLGNGKMNCIKVANVT